jgi:hypothetical protein
MEPSAAGIAVGEQQVPHRGFAPVRNDIGAGGGCFGARAGTAARGRSGKEARV